MPRSIHLPFLRAASLMLFFQCGTEFELGGYLAVFYTRELGMPTRTASCVLAGFWAAIMVSRLLLSRLLLRLSPRAVVSGCATTSFVGAVVLGTTGSSAVAVLGGVLVGAALAGIFPTVLGVAGARFPDHSGTVLGMMFTVALTGGMTMPWLAGQMAEAVGVRWVFVLVSASFLAVVALNEAASARSR
jgi:FHS family L-fucose permease-like MFS transporter